jgi:bifunctional pyridoxal-dependent enzyme with beta-cystathionase and maltose regulon repressor activities
MLDDLAWESLRSRRARSGAATHDDVLPMWIAEMDFTRRAITTARQQQTRR